MPRFSPANIRKMRKADILALVFFVFIALSIALTMTLVSRMPAVKRAFGISDSAMQARRQHRQRAITYSQPDSGHGDGSISLADDGLAAELFAFNPNTADSTALLRLGLEPWQVRAIYRYRAKGGHYRRAEDFARLPGLTFEQYRRLKPYINIPATVMAADVVKATPEKPRKYEEKRPASSPQYEKKLTLSDPRVDINTADTALLKRIPGIGSYFARRIVTMRKTKKAFTSVDELRAIRNFPEAALAYMVASQTFPPLRINTMSKTELLAHPLLNRVQVREIMHLRRTTGRIRSLEDLALMPSFTPAEMARIEPYLQFE